MLTLEKPNAVLPLLPIPIVPEHVWSSIDEKAVKTYQAEPTDGQPVVGSGPFRLVEGTAGGSTYRFERNPDYWQGAPHIDEVVFRVYKAEDPMVQALIKGEIDFAEGITALQVRSLEGKEGITAQNGDSPGFDEIAFNTGAVDTETDEPIGDGHEALKDPAFRYALQFAIDRDLIIERAYQGAGDPGDTIIPAIYGDYHWTPPEEDAPVFDLDRADELLTEAGYARDSDGSRLMPDGSDFGKLRLFARSESTISSTVMDFFAEWLGELGIDSETTVMESNKLTNVIIDGEYDAFEWGWYVEPDPDSMLAYLTCDQRGVLERLVVVQRGVRRALRAAERRERRRDAPGPRQADAGALLLRRAVPGDGVHLDRRGLPQRPVGLPPAAAGPGRDPADPVRHPQLPEHPAGRRGRRLRRRRDRARRGGVAERRRRRRGRRRGLQHGRPGRRRRAAGRTGRSAAASSRCGDGVRRPTANDPMTQAAEPEPPTEAAPAVAAAQASAATGRRKSYGRYVLGKVAGAASSLAFVLVLGFFLFRVLPGDPARTLGRGKFKTEEQLEAFRADYGLDQPLPQQFFTYLKNTAQGDLGVSLPLPGAGLGPDRRPALADAPAGRPRDPPLGAHRRLPRRHQRLEPRQGHRPDLHRDDAHALLDAGVVARACSSSPGSRSAWGRCPGSSRPAGCTRSTPSPGPSATSATPRCTWCCRCSRWSWSTSPTSR